MRGHGEQQSNVFSYVSLEERVPVDHPLRPIRRAVDEVLRAMSKEFDGMYARTGRPSIPPERLLRALLLLTWVGKTICVWLLNDEPSSVIPWRTLADGSKSLAGVPLFVTVAGAKPVKLIAYGADVPPRVRTLLGPVGGSLSSDLTI